jgi:inorganic phosphate transporter, PiT family
MTIIALLIAATLLVAYANGANDNFKGVATLYGSGGASWRTAHTIATVAAIAGSIVSIYLAAELVRAFSGKGLVPDAVAASPRFMLAVALGAGGTVLLATRLAIPISTTHGLTGALVGAGAMAAGASLNLGALGKTFIAPLLLSPPIALVLTACAYGLARRFVVRRQLHADDVLQVERMTLAPGAAAAVQGAPQQVASAGGLLRGAHAVTAAVLCFARSLNDTPKIVALMLAAGAVDVRLGMLAVAAAMAAGGLISARGVALTMSQRIAKMNDGQAFSANLVSGLLVIAASRFGLPVSTTHVCVGAISGVGLVNGTADWRLLRQIVASWVLTLPIAAAIAAASWTVLNSFVA